MSILRYIRDALRPRQSSVEPTGSRADKYGSGRDLLQEQREAARQLAEAFVRSVSEAAKAIRIESGTTESDPRRAAMDAMDSSDTGLPAFKGVTVEFGQVEMALMPWFMKQGFIGYQNAAFIAQHWLIYKACSTPVDDAIRNGYDITTDTGEDLPADALKILKRADRRVGIKGQLRDFGTKGRIFGVRIALFEVESDDPEYYEKPFNPDGVKPGSYKGISQVDPYWTAPILDITSAAVPSSKHFYEPTWWLIGSKRVHRSHLVIFRYADPPDVLRPLYLFGGIPLPQMIMERVYCAERTANEAPALALSKRTTVWLTNMVEIMADSRAADEKLKKWIAYRDNFGIKVGSKEKDQFQQFDTPLADFDSLVMTQYGLVAATAGMPITKLLGTTPGGFAATGEYDEASYHELLESGQERDYSPFLEHHHKLVMLSEVIPKFKELRDTEITVKWHELDAVTHLEQAQINLDKAQTDATLIAANSITEKDSRKRLATDKDSGYHGIGVDLETEPVPEAEDPEAAAEGARGGRYGAKAALGAEQAQARSNQKLLKDAAAHRSNGAG